MESFQEPTKNGLFERKTGEVVSKENLVPKSAEYVKYIGQKVLPF